MSIVVKITCFSKRFPLNIVVSKKSFTVGDFSCKFYCCEKSVFFQGTKYSSSFFVAFIQVVSMFSTKVLTVIFMRLLQLTLECRKCWLEILKSFFLEWVIALL